jgi:hypothetical protein
MQVIVKPEMPIMTEKYIISWISSEKENNLLPNFDNHKNNEHTNEFLFPVYTKIFRFLTESELCPPYSS